MAIRALPNDELELWHAWKHAHEAVMNGVARALQDRCGLSGADFGVLSRLVESGDGELRQQELADSMRWDKSRLSHQLSRMEARGLLSRLRESAKLVRVRVTIDGRVALDSARIVHANAVRAHLIDFIPEKSRARMLALLQALQGKPVTRGAAARR